MIQLICRQAQTLKKFTDENLASASFCWEYLIKNKEIKINGKKTGQDVLLHEGDVVSYYMTQKQEDRLGFCVVYEDENVCIIDKESGVNAEAVFAELSRKSGENVAFIHRLDRNTMGLMVFAKTPNAERELLQAFKNRTVEKRYLALCVDNFPCEQDTLTAYLKKNEKCAHVRVYLEKAPDRERIITQYHVLEHRQDGTALTEITLHTGKTHQIRAHMAFIGCHVIGDTKYGKAEYNKARNRTRQQLVAKYLTFQFEGGLSYLNGRTFISSYEL